ncbi:hypothetical protein FQN49_002855 [Arthroderma sp. PD_2]|nr:hypothetical protein FQN49_002855 [Arthroderma sp. PD_2]
MPSLRLRNMVKSDSGAAAVAFEPNEDPSGGHNPPRIAILITTIIAVVIVGISLFWFVRWRTKRGRYHPKYTRRQPSTRTGNTEISQKKQSSPSTGKGTNSAAQGGFDWNPESTFAKPSTPKPYVAKPYTHSQAMLSSSSIKKFWHNSMGASRAPKLQVRNKPSEDAENELEGLHHRDGSGGNPLLRETVTEIELPSKAFPRTLSTHSSSIFHLDRPSVGDRPVSTTSTLDRTPHNVPSPHNGAMISKYPWSPTTHITPIEPSYNSMTFFNNRESCGTQGGESINNVETAATTSKDRQQSQLYNS